MEEWLGKLAHTCNGILLNWSRHLVKIRQTLRDNTGLDIQGGRGTWKETWAEQVHSIKAKDSGEGRGGTVEEDCRILAQDETVFMHWEA